MSETPNDMGQEPTELTQDERTYLKHRADTLGISYQPNIPTEKLKELINSALADSQDLSNVGRPKKDETKEEVKVRKRREASALVRCRINCNDPAKKDWPGEVISVSNALVGTLKKFVPYSTDEPYHIPNMMLNVLREKKVQVFQTKPGKMGIPVRTSKLINAYTIEVLPPLTSDELAKLAQAQMARRSTDDNA